MLRRIAEPVLTNAEYCVRSAESAGMNPGSGSPDPEFSLPPSQSSIHYSSPETFR